MQVSINDLPDDILYDIFSRAKKTHFSSVCQSWLSLSRSRQTTLMLLESPVTLFPLRARGFESLISVTVDHRLTDEGHHMLTDDHLVSLADEFPGLERLELLGCDEVTPASLLYLVSQCPSLVYLHVQVTILCK